MKNYFSLCTEELSANEETQQMYKHKAKKKKPDVD